MLGYLAPKGVGFGQNGAISETLVRVGCEGRCESHVVIPRESHRHAQRNPSI
jgi:hypothetical protein